MAVQSLTAQNSMGQLVIAAGTVVLAGPSVSIITSKPFVHSSTSSKQLPAPSTTSSSFHTTAPSRAVEPTKGFTGNQQSAGFFLRPNMPLMMGLAACGCVLLVLAITMLGVFICRRRTRDGSPRLSPRSEKAGLQVGGSKGRFWKKGPQGGACLGRRKAKRGAAGGNISSSWVDVDEWVDEKYAVRDKTGPAPAYISSPQSQDGHAWNLFTNNNGVKVEQNVLTRRDSSSSINKGLGLLGTPRLENWEPNAKGAGAVTVSMGDANGDHLPRMSLELAAHKERLRNSPSVQQGRFSRSDFGSPSLDILAPSPAFAGTDSPRELQRGPWNSPALSSSTAAGSVPKTRIQLRDPPVVHSRPYSVVKRRPSVLTQDPNVDSPKLQSASPKLEDFQFVNTDSPSGAELAGEGSGKANPTGGLPTSFSQYTIKALGDGNVRGTYYSIPANGLLPLGKPHPSEPYANSAPRENAPSGTPLEPVLSQRPSVKRPVPVRTESDSGTTLVPSQSSESIGSKALHTISGPETDGEADRVASSARLSGAAVEGGILWRPLPNGESEPVTAFDSHEESLPTIPRSSSEHSVRPRQSTTMIPSASTGSLGVTALTPTSTSSHVTVRQLSPARASMAGTGISGDSPIDPKFISGGPFELLKGARVSRVEDQIIFSGVTNRPSRGASVLAPQFGGPSGSRVQSIAMMRPTSVASSLGDESAAIDEALRNVEAVMTSMGIPRAALDLEALSPSKDSIRPGGPAEIKVAARLRSGSDERMRQSMFRGVQQYLDTVAEAQEESTNPSPSSVRTATSAQIKSRTIAPETSTPTRLQVRRASALSLAVPRFSPSRANKASAIDNHRRRSEAGSLRPGSSASTCSVYSTSSNLFSPVGAAITTERAVVTTDDAALALHAFFAKGVRGGGRSVRATAHANSMAAASVVATVGGSPGLSLSLPSTPTLAQQGAILASEESPVKPRKTLVSQGDFHRPLRISPVTSPDLALDMQGSNVPLVTASPLSNLATATSPAPQSDAAVSPLLGLYSNSPAFSAPTAASCDVGASAPTEGLGLYLDTGLPAAQALPGSAGAGTAALSLHSPTPSGENVLNLTVEFPAPPTHTSIARPGGVASDTVQPRKSLSPQLPTQREHVRPVQQSTPQAQAQRWAERQAAGVGVGVNGVRDSWSFLTSPEFTTPESKKSRTAGYFAPTPLDDTPTRPRGHAPVNRAPLGTPPLQIPGGGPTSARTGNSPSPVVSVSQASPRPRPSGRLRPQRGATVPSPHSAPGTPTGHSSIPGQPVTPGAGGLGSASIRDSVETALRSSGRFSTPAAPRVQALNLSTHVNLNGNRTSRASVASAYMSPTMQVFRFYEARQSQYEQDLEAPSEADV